MPLPITKQKDTFPMNPVEWSESLANGLPPMDKTHQEFIEHYNRLVQALQAGEVDALMDHLDVFIAHTVAHFDQENRWMEAVQFPGCHKAEHDRVLSVVRDVRDNLRVGDLFLARRLIEELFPWFQNHANTMDAALAFYLGQVGYDVETGQFMAKPSCTPKTADMADESAKTGAAACVCTHTPS
jgi:hemerythrin